jgi:hypothetical protein
VSSASEFPLSVSRNNRYLVTASGTPWLMVGDAPQSLIGDNSITTANSFIDDRAAHGFNTLWINVICDSYTFCSFDGKGYNDANNTQDSLAPFTSGNDQNNWTFGGSSSPPYCTSCNATYFAQAHAIIAHAQADGIAVVLDPISTDGCGNGNNWYTTLTNNGDGTVSTSDDDYRYGQYLGNTFKDLNNIIWMSGNDFQCYGTASANNDALSVANGIANTDPSALQTIELNYNASKSTDDTVWSSRLNLDGVYSYLPTYTELSAAYSSSPMLPTFLEESNYEYEQLTGNSVSGSDPGGLDAMRREEWWTATGGAAGQVYGSFYTDAIGCGSACNGHAGTSLSMPAAGTFGAEVDSPGVTQLGYVTSLLTSIAWQNLAPTASLVSSTSPAESCPVFGSMMENCTTAAETPDGTLALIYDPMGASVTVALGQMAAGQTTTANWYDPTNGQYTTIGSYTDTGSQTFTPPGNNQAGDTDWVLLLSNPVLQPAVSSSPSSKDFGGQRVGTVSAAQVFTITNTGSAALNIASVGLGGGDAGQYVVSNDQCSGQAVAPEGTCTVDVAFAPTSAGPHDNASLVIKSDAPSSPDSLGLTGHGLRKWRKSDFRVRHLMLRSNGLATFDITTPTAGVVNVLESAANRVTQRSSATVAPVLPSRLVLGRARRVVRTRGKFHMTVPAKLRLTSLIAHHRGPFRVRLWVTFTPRYAPALLLGVYDLVVT